MTGDIWRFAMAIYAVDIANRARREQTLTESLQVFVTIAWMQCTIRAPFLGDPRSIWRESGEYTIPVQC